MEKENNNNDMELSILEMIKDASLHLQYEQGFSRIDRQKIRKLLGINWFRAKNYRTAKEAIVNSRYQPDSRLPNYITALINSVLNLLNELLPLFLLIKNKDDILSSSSSIPNAEDLLQRLRIYYIGELTCLKQPDNKLYQANNILDTCNDLSKPQQSSLIFQVWNKNLEQGLYIILNELNLNQKFAEPLINGEQYFDKEQNPDVKKILNHLVEIMPKLSNDIKKHYKDHSKILDSTTLCHFIPSKEKIAQFIRNHLIEKINIRNAVIFMEKMNFTEQDRQDRHQDREKSINGNYNPENLFDEKSNKNEKTKNELLFEIKEEKENEESQLDDFLKIVEKTHWDKQLILKELKNLQENESSSLDEKNLTEFTNRIINSLSKIVKHKK